MAFAHFSTQHKGKTHIRIIVEFLILGNKNRESAVVRKAGASVVRCCRLWLGRMTDPVPSPCLCYTTGFPSLRDKTCVVFRRGALDLSHSYLVSSLTVTLTKIFSSQWCCLLLLGRSYVIKILSTKALHGLKLPSGSTVLWLHPEHGKRKVRTSTGSSPKGLGARTIHLHSSWETRQAPNMKMSLRAPN